MNRGDVVWVVFPGAVQTKRRPAVVLSSAAYHASRPDVILGVVTSQIASATAPTDHVLRQWQSAGLVKPSAFRAFVITLPRAAVLSVIGSLAVSDLASVEQSLRTAFDLR